MQEYLGSVSGPITIVRGPDHVRTELPDQQRIDLINALNSCPPGEKVALVVFDGDNHPRIMVRTT
jgi:hypothetical protein